MSIYFDELFRPVLGSLVRGVNLGDAISRIETLENTEKNDSESRMTLTCSARLHPSFGLFYNVYYIYNSTKNITKISISVQYNQYIDNLCPFSDFTKLITEIDGYLQKHYGNPNTEIRKDKFAGESRFDTWEISSDSQIKILKVVYAEPKNKIKKAFRLDFSLL